MKGHSLHGIATAPNKDGIPSPRDTTNRRVPQKKDPSEVIRVRREELRIIDEETVQERLRNIKSKYARDPEQRVAGLAHGASSLYPLSGLLFCDACSSPMSIGGGAKDRRYYVCASSRNGRCAVDASVRVDVVQRCILEALRDRLLSGGVDEIRKQLARRMGELGRTQNAEAKASRDRLQQAEARVANLVNVFASGERSAALSQALKEAEATLAAERRSLAELERLAARPVRLLSPAEVQRMPITRGDHIRNARLDHIVWRFGNDTMVNE